MPGAFFLLTASHSKSITISDVLVDTASQVPTIYHTEDRPFEAGRTVPIVTGKGADVIPAEWSARTGYV